MGFSPLPITGRAADSVGTDLWPARSKKGVTVRKVNPDKTGRFGISAQFDAADDFSEGRALVGASAR